jgi:hypothetical protein
MDQLQQTISNLKAERDVARHELAERNKLIEEIRTALGKEGDAHQTISWLIARLEHSSCDH